MNIGTAARRSGLPPRTICYYEAIGLLAPGRAANNYRDYAEADIRRLRFLARSRSLGFSVEACRRLLSLHDDGARRKSADVKALAEAKLAEIDRKLAELNALRDTLSPLVATCRGDRRPDCPIIEGLAGARRRMKQQPEPAA